MKSSGCLQLRIVAVLNTLILAHLLSTDAFTPRTGLHKDVLRSPSNVPSLPKLVSTPPVYDKTRVWMTDVSSSDRDGDGDGDGDGEAARDTEVSESSISEKSDEISPEELSRLQKFRQRLFPPKPDDGLTFRQRLAKAGMSVALSYGWVSNVSYSITVSLAWYIFSKRTGLSPLAPGQWKSFLAVYAGFYVFNNIVRPVRFALSVSVSMYFDRVIQMIQDKFQVKKGVAIGLTVFLANFVGTIALMCLGISIAATAARVPVFPGKP